MLSKEGYIEKTVRDIRNGEMKLEYFVSEHFELVEVLKEVGWDGFNVDELKTIIKACQYNAEKLNSLRNSQPYKFEDLKVGMWIWDDKERKCNKIIDIDENGEIDFYYITESISRYIVKFEENRFFPVQMANMRCE